eukprot:1158627-Pelagomonas_calceolata.AAC.5
MVVLWYPGHVQGLHISVHAARHVHALVTHPQQYTRRPSTTMHLSPMHNYALVANPQLCTDPESADNNPPMSSVWHLGTCQALAYQKLQGMCMHLQCDPDNCRNEHAS